MNAKKPTTVKQFRSLIGSYKWVAECIANYAVLLGALENAADGLESTERMQRMLDASLSFIIAKEH